jgi:hypothetical protein
VHVTIETDQNTCTITDSDVHWVRKRERRGGIVPLSEDMWEVEPESTTQPAWDGGAMLFMVAMRVD